MSVRENTDAASLPDVPGYAPALRKRRPRAPHKNGRGREVSLKAWLHAVQQAQEATDNPKAHRALFAAVLCCRDWIVLREGSTLKFVLLPCDRKFCAPCLEEWARSLLRRTLSVVGDIPPRELRHLVLSLPNVPHGTLEQGIKRLYACFRAWRDEGRRKAHGAYWKAVEGWAWKLECHDSQHAGGWHPHLHVLLHCPRGFELRNGSPAFQAWHRIAERATGRRCTAPHITRCTDGKSAAREVAKYACKPLLLFELAPSQLAEVAGAVHRVRFHQSGGSLRTPPEKDPGKTGAEYLGTLRGAFHDATAMHGSKFRERMKVSNALEICREFARQKAADEDALKGAPAEVWQI